MREKKKKKYFARKRVTTLPWAGRECDWRRAKVPPDFANTLGCRPVRSATSNAVYQRTPPACCSP